MSATETNSGQLEGAALADAVTALSAWAETWIERDELEGRSAA